jgi:hypothetical protein
MSGFATSEIMKHSITMTLQHFRVNIKTRISQLSNFSSQQFDTGSTITKDDGLVNLELTMNHHVITYFGE